MSNFLLMRGGYEPVNIQAESRLRYILAIRSFQLEDDPFPFVEFFCQNLLDGLRKVESMLSGDGPVPGGGPSRDAGRGRALSEFLATDQVADQVARLLAALGDGERSSSELMADLGLKHRPTFRENYLDPALRAGLVERTVPDKPNSGRQRYRRVR